MSRGLFRGTILRRLEDLRDGELTLLEGSARHVFGRPGTGDSLRATVRVHDPGFWWDVALGGSIGAGESWMEGAWSADDPAAVVRLFLRNEKALQGVEGGLARLAEPVRRFLHALRRNTRAGSRRNIAAHYDLGNEFFSLLLDETMTYSCAFFETPETSLREAQVAKLDRLCRRLGLRPGDHLLEIGTGWGSMAIHAASRYGCRVTTATISKAQHEVARERVRRAGLSERVTVLLRDYRDLEGVHDGIVSVEMIEAVGHRFLDGYFAACDRLLRPGGRFALQAITIAEERYEKALRSVDFIQRYIFPGSFIPSMGAIRASVARATGFRIAEVEEIGPHYVRTLRLWRENLMREAGRIRALGVPEELLRMFEFYFAYCEGGFAERSIGDVQVLLEKPGA